MIVSHDVGGQQDAYRTIYMHLRNGASSDCEAAWSQTVPTLSDPELSEYVQHLNETGCPQNPPRNPDPAHWGTNQQTIPGVAGQQVARGAFLAQAGNTGPGGSGDRGDPTPTCTSSSAAATPRTTVGTSSIPTASTRSQAVTPPA